MPLDKNSYNLKLYNLLKTRGYRPVPLDSKGERSEAPQEADVFKFTFSKDDEKVGTMYATVEEGDIVLYYDEQEVSGSSDANTSGTEFTDSFSGLVRHLKHWAMTRQLGFRTEPNDKLASDMAQREYMKKKENISEGYYPMGKSASYNDAIPTVKIILQHTRQIQEGEQRFRHVNKIFLENSLGERILAPTIRPGIAQVYARHLAEGGVPNDERWNHIKSLCEDYTKMAGFVRAVKNNQFNESAQQLVNEGVNHYQGLRETLGRMRGHRGYNTYFESWTPTLMEDESSDNTLNELFVQETLDPRIESVLPILSKLRKTVGEMKEVNELAEWAEELTEAPGSETLAHNEKTEKQRLDAFDLEESDDAVKAGQTARDKIKKPAFMRKAAGEKPATLGDVERSQQHRSSQAMVGQKGQEVEESGLQAYLGNKKYGKAGMDALRKAGRDGASKEKMASIRAKYDKLDEEGMEEGWNDRLDDPDRYEEYLERLKDLADYNRKRDIEDPPQKHKAPTDDSKKQADESVDDMFSLSGKLPATDRIDNVSGQDMSFDDKMRASTIKRLLQNNPNLKIDELPKNTADLIKMLDQHSKKGVSEMDNRTPAGDRREQRAYSPEALKQREEELQAALKKVSPEMRKKLGLPEPKEGVAEGAKWRSNPDAYDIDDEGNKSPRTHDKFAYDPLTRRQSTAGDAQTARGKKAALKTSLKMAQGRHGPKGQLPEEQGVAEGRYTPPKNTYYIMQTSINSDEGRSVDVFDLMYNGKIIKRYNLLASADRQLRRLRAAGNPVQMEDEQGVAEGLDPIKKKRLNALIDLYREANDPNEYANDQAVYKDDVIARIRLEFGDKIADRVEKSATEGVAEGPEDNRQWSNKDNEQFRRAVRDIESNFGPDDAWTKTKQRQIKQRIKTEPMSGPLGKLPEQGVAEDLDANQKRVGQLGPTESVKNNNIGKVVGASESIEAKLKAITEMDKSQPSSDRGGESSGDPYAKGGKATPAKAKDAAKDAEGVLNTAMDNAHKKDVKEGQEDLDAILRIIRK